MSNKILKLLDTPNFLKLSYCKSMFYERSEKEGICKYPMLPEILSNSFTGNNHS